MIDDSGRPVIRRPTRPAVTGREWLVVEERGGLFPEPGPHVAIHGAVLGPYSTCKRTRASSRATVKHERDFVIVLVGRRYRGPLIARSAKPAVTDREEGGIAPIGPRVLEERAARRNGSGRS